MGATFYTGRARSPVDNCLTGVELRARLDRLVGVSANAVLDVKEAGSSFQHADVGLGRAKAWEASADFVVGECFDVKLVLSGAGQHTGDDLAVSRPDLEDAHFVVELGTGLLFEILPQFVSAFEQRHIAGMLEVGEADEPRLAVRAAVVVSGGKAINAEHALPTARQVIKSRAADAAGSEHDAVPDRRLRHSMTSREADSELQERVMDQIYLDNNATTPMLPLVREAMEPYFSTISGNPASAHYAGRHARKALENARERVASLVGADAGEVIFTSGGTEANNLALFGLAAEPPAHIVASPIEHPSVAEPVEQLAARGFAV